MNKICFFTSSLGISYEDEAGKHPCVMDNRYGLHTLLQNHWPKNARVLMISSDPDASEINDFYINLYRQSFTMSGLSYDMIDCYDRRYQPNIQAYDVLILAGGHTPTQNRYFKAINLKAKLQNYQGIIIGISAGSMNAADIVYAHPELEGEAIDPNFQRYLDGLGLFPIRILPHFQDIKDTWLDGKHLIADIALPDSYHHDFYALNDGSYFVVANNRVELYGDAYYFNQGVITYLLGMVANPIIENIDTFVTKTNND